MIPDQATENNKLADKNFVNSSIQTNTATFRGSFNLVTELHLPYDASKQEIQDKLDEMQSELNGDNNDYVFIQVPIDQTQTDKYARVDRYKCVKTSEEGVVPETFEWRFEWSLNNSSFTSDQWAAINSGITEGKVRQIDELDSTLSSHLADTNNPHNVTPEQIGAVSQEDLEDGLEVDEITANDITIDGKKPSLEGHTHSAAEVGAVDLGGDTMTGSLIIVGHGLTVQSSNGNI